MTLQYDVLDTIYTDDNHMDLFYIQQRCTNIEGIIFLLYSDGMVYSFDPFGAKQMKKLEDLEED